MDGASTGNRTLLVGFAIIFASVAVLVVLVFNHMGSMADSQKLNETLRAKTEAAFRMAEAIRNRNFSLAITPGLEEYFDRDDERSKFAAFARDFLTGREVLIETGLDDSETKALDRVVEKIREAQPLVESAMTEAVEQGDTLKVASLVSNAWRAQTLVLKELDRFVLTVNEQASRVAERMNAEMRRNLQIAVGLGVIVLLLSGLTALVVIRREVMSRRALVQAADEISGLNERLQEENVRISSELDVAKQLQEMILPRKAELIAITELDISAHMRPADEVGGDYYDVLQCCEGHVLVGIGDVTGHGLESGVIMLMVQSTVRALMEHGEPDLRQSLATINQVIFRNGARMASDKNLSLAVVHYFDGRINVAGQHEELLIVRQGDVERVDTIDLGFPIGLEENITPFISEYSTHLDSGDVLVLYTDGIVEAENAKGELYGMDRMCRIIAERWRQSAEAIQEAVVSDVYSFIGDSKVYDDVTMVVMKRH